MKLPHEDAWDAWSPMQLAQKLSGVDADWYIVGGWALDLWLGKQRRQHDDLEFATLPQYAPKLASHLSELIFFEVKAGQLSPWDLNQKFGKDVWQFWGADLEVGRWRVDMMLERGTREFWKYKRSPSFEQLRDSAVRTNADGIRYLAPANVLLFKAKYCRAKDEDDFQAALPNLTASDRATLRRWLSLCHVDHKWLQHL